MSLTQSPAIPTLLSQIIVGLFHFLLISIPLFFTISNEELFEFNKMILTYIIALLILACWGLKVILTNHFSHRKTLFDLPLAALLFSQILSTVFSIHTRTSLFGYYTRFHGGLFSTITYIFLFYAFIHHVHKKHVAGLLISLLLGAGLASLYAFPEHFGFSPSCLLIDQAFHANCWLQDVQTRVFGTFGQPNWLAAYLIMILPVGYIFFFQWQFSTLIEKKYRRHLQFAGVVFVSLLFCVLLFTQSRSGFLGFALSVAILGLFLILKVLTKPLALTHQLKSNMPLILAILLILIYFGSPFTPSYKSLFRSFNQNQLENTNSESVAPEANRLDIGGTDSGEIRKIVWEGALRVFLRYPLLGSGVETFAYSYYKDRPVEHNMVSEWDFLYNKAHNEFLNILATSGVIGFSTYILYQLTILLYFSKTSFPIEDSKNNVVTILKSFLSFFTKPSEKNTAWLSVGALSGISALHVSNFFGFSTVVVSILMYLLPAFVVCLQQDEIEIKPTKKQTPLQLLTAFIFVCVILFFILRVLLFWLADYYLSNSKRMLRAGQYEQALTSAKNAVQFSSSEGVMYEAYSKVAAQYALVLASNQEWETASELANSSLKAIDTAVSLNPVHLNFYKSRNQILVLLSQIEPTLLEEASKTMLAAIELAPTDPKLVFNLAVIQLSLDQRQLATQNFQKAIQMKPNYDSARAQLAQIYEEDQEFQKAIDQYQYILDFIAPNNAELSLKIQQLEASSSSLNK